MEENQADSSVLNILGAGDSLLHHSMLDSLGYRVK
jgi:hypothetical protein